MCEEFCFMKYTGTYNVIQHGMIRNKRLCWRRRNRDLFITWRVRAKTISVLQVLKYVYNIQDSFDI